VGSVVISTATTSSLSLSAIISESSFSSPRSRLLLEG
jgi:hypothetical protein